MGEHRNDRLKRLSKTLAWVLRHRPDGIGIELDPAGWVDVSVLLAAMVAAGHTIDEADLEQVVATNDKKRYELVDGRIRAAQGHSVAVDLGLEAMVPPDVLYHGTVERFLDAIDQDGLQPGTRTHVHLSADTATARAVGQRRGRPVVLEVDAARMHADGFVFRRASNGVWLVDQVPPRYLTR